MKWLNVGQITSWIKAHRRVDTYRIDELQIGGNCGCCGHWIPNEIFPKEWSWGLCQNCINDSVEMDVVKYLKLK